MRATLSETIGLETFGQDLRYALRQLGKNRSFALFSIATLGIGLCSAIAAFSILDNWLIKPLALKDAARLEHVWRTGPADHTQPMFFFSYGEYLKFARAQKCFSSISGTFYRTYTLTKHGEPQNLMGETTTANLFTTLGVKAMLGRTFLPSDATGEKTVILSHAFWSEKFGSSRSVIGSAIRLNDEAYRVIGILPANFSYRILDQPVDADVWTVIQRNDPNYQEDSNAAVAILGRLKPEVRRAQAQAELNILQLRIDGQRRKLPEDLKGTASLVAPLQQDNARQIRFSLLVLGAGSSFLLLIACANACALMLSRNAARQAEFAMRIALGSGARRLFQQLLSESLLLYATATAVGLGAAAAAVRGFELWNPFGILPPSGVEVNYQVCVIAALLALATCVLFGTLPAFFSSRPVLNDVLASMGRGLTLTRKSVQALSWITGAQIALALVFLTGTGLLFSTLLNLENQKFGFAAGHVTIVEVSLPYRHYGEISKAIAFENRLTERLREMPGVTASAVGPDPIRGDEFPGAFAIANRPVVKDADMPHAAQASIGPQYFQALKVPLLEGSDFPISRGANSEPEAIVNELIAERDFRGVNPIGQHIRLGATTDPETAHAPWYRIVGVVGDTRSIAYNQTLWKSDPRIYLDFRQERQNPIGVSNWGARRCSFLIASFARSGLDLGKVKQQVLSLDSELPVGRILPLDNQLAVQLAQPKMRAEVLTALAGVSLLLASIGLYGILSQVVARGKRNIAIRLALGAGRKEVVRLIVSRALAITAGGVVCGTAISFAGAKAVHSVLYGISPLNPMLYAAATFVLFAVSLAAALIPARRAATLDPMTTLRSE